MAKNVKQELVTEFYDQLVFPSKTSHSEYEALVPDNLNGYRVGDFGCGQSLFLDTFRRLGYDAVFLDIAPNALAAIDYGTKIEASLTDIPLPDNHMHAIFCIGVVHHIPDIEKAISELVRVLKTGRQLVLGVYAARTVQARLRAAYDSGFVARRLVKAVARVLIWYKNRRNGLQYGSPEHLKRVDDLLITPLVRYAPSSFYQSLIEKSGASIVNVSRISQMSILFVEKHE